MGIDERRTRERERRKSDIIASAWTVAERDGWSTFSIEQVAKHAELGRATVYGYFESLEELVLVMARSAVDELEQRVAAAPGLVEALDVPVRLAQQQPAAFALLFEQTRDKRPHLHNADLDATRTRAREIVGRVRTLAAKAGSALPEDAREAAAFVAGISMAGALVPDLRSSTPLRHRFHEFALKASRDDDEGD